jgi:putative tryptophan/tyrosine transport system substrate-binding protein
MANPGAISRFSRRPDRRRFIALTAAGVAWPSVAPAQPRERMRRIGALLAITADDPESQARMAAFAQGLQQAGWTIGQNARVDYRFAGANADDLRRSAADLVALAPDVILAQSSGAVVALLQATRSIPIVFTTVADPVGAGFVESLARPGGNATGFTLFDYAIAAKWAELLKDIAPGVKRVAVLREFGNVAGPAQFGAMQAVAPALGMELRPVDTRDPGEIERAIAAFAPGSSGGIIVTGSAAATLNRKLIVALAARHRLPAVYNSRFFVADGGLISYGSEAIDQFRRAAGYVDRILKGAKPADLPVQAPVKYELVVNLTTAKALGLDLPASVLARADEVIE